LPRQVDAIDHPFAEDALFLLGQTDDRELVQAEVACGGERDRELTTPAIDHDQIRQIPHAVTFLARTRTPRRARRDAVTRLPWLAGLE
jgi:hypothetical protein